MTMMTLFFIACLFLIVDTQSSIDNLNSSIASTNLNNGLIKQNRHNHTHQNDSHHHHHSLPNQTQKESTKELRRKAKITYDKVLPCINDAWMMKSWPAINFTFPSDAEEHYKDLNTRAARFRKANVHAYANYSGPWIENLFISNYINKPLSFFNGLIPIFIQWIDTDIASKRDARDINTFLKEVLKPDVLYFAVSQGDIGLGRAGTDHPNILVFASGGYGHVPLPLIRSEVPRVELPAKYDQELGFFGTMNKHVQSRVTMLNIIRTTAESLNIRHLSHKFGEGPTWKQDMEKTKLNLAPRGYGRSSFRFSESIQMGRMPVWVFDDIPWIPYEGTNLSVHTYGFAGGSSPYKGHTSLEVMVDKIKNMTDVEYANKLELLKNARKWFTYGGVFEQIEMFLEDPFGPSGGQLRCTIHPKTERCCG